MAPRHKGCATTPTTPPMMGVLGRTLHAVLEHIEGGNKPPLEYPAPSFSRQSRSSWLSRRMEPLSSSSFGSRSTGTAAPLVAVKPEPQEMSLRRCSRNNNLVRNKGRREPSPPRSHFRLVKPKKEPTTMVKQEHMKMSADLDAGLEWSRDDYVRQEMEHERRTLEEIAERYRVRNEGGVIVLSDIDEKATAPTKPANSGDPAQGCSNDNNVNGDDDGDGDDYTVFYNLLDMN
ncbi:hypothetical protein D1007_29401 [Hordeum vulgare]|nr:hypothetical protein D1007_29401 [Hordeum vulgare]